MNVDLNGVFIKVEFVFFIFLFNVENGSEMMNKLVLIMVVVKVKGLIKIMLFFIFNFVG